MTAIQALTFDVFGTVVDWRGSVAREAERLLGPKGHALDWGGFADDWRARYVPAMAKVSRGARPFVILDELHRENLVELLAEWGITDLSAAETGELNLAWHRLDPWPDALPGLRRLKQDFVIATFSNGNVSLLVDMARRAGLPWDFVFSAELFRHYKPAPECYLGAVELLSLTPPEVMLVAAHNDDLRAAADLGLATAFVARPGEHGPDQQRDLAPAGEYTCTAADFEELATTLAALTR